MGCQQPRYFVYGSGFFSFLNEDKKITIVLVLAIALAILSFLLVAEIKINKRSSHPPVILDNISV